MTTTSYTRAPRAPDRTVETHPGEYNELTYPVFIHENVIDDVADAPVLRKRLSLVLQHLASRGQTSVVKSCAPPNRGWRRSPMGGSGGKQQYLWWTTGGSAVVPNGLSRSMGLDRSVWVRKLRHHDDFRPLGAGDLAAEYLPLSQQEITGQDDALVVTPWTDQQSRFILSEDVVRLVYGHPGSGKTTALWQSISARAGETVLYTSWSTDLVELAIDYLRSFAPSSTTVLGYDFRSLLGLICGTDVPLLTENERIRLLEDTLRTSRVSPRDLGPWAGRPAQMCAELRAVMLGAATSEERAISAGKVRRLSRDAYAARRSAQMGEDSVNSMMRVVAALERGGGLEHIFPELAAAARALEIIEAGHAPNTLTDIDRMVVDEAQDLSLVELETLIALCAKAGERRALMPWLLISGDEGQTVSPSGFEWGPLNAMLTRRIANPTEFGMERKLRSPRRIAQVIDRIGGLYRSLDRTLRPGAQGDSGAPDALEANVYHTIAADAREGAALAREMSGADGLALVSLDDRAPTWLDADTRRLVLSPADVKGLEYRAVCVLTPAWSIAMVGTGSRDRGAPTLDYHEARTRIDRMRVAVSRATETLIFMDIAGRGDAALSADMLGEHISCAAPDLLDQIRAADEPPETMALSRINESSALLASNPQAAWQRARQAAAMLGQADLPGAVADPEVRTAAQIAVLRVGARLLGAAQAQADVRSACRKAALALPDPGPHATLWNSLETWTDAPETSPIDMLDAALVSDEPMRWLGRSLAPRYQALQSGLDRAASDPASAGFFAGDVENWLHIAGHAGNMRGRAALLRLAAFDTLAGDGQFHTATDILAKVPKKTLRDTAALRERDGKLLSASLMLLAAGQAEKAAEPFIDYCRERAMTASRMNMNRNYEEALAICDELQKLMDAGPIFVTDENTRSTVLLMRAEALDSLGHVSEAIEIFERITRACKMDRIKSMAHLGMANILYQAGNTDGAIRRCHASLNLYNKSSPDTHGAADIAMLASSDAGNHRAALVYALLALENRPDDPTLTEQVCILLHAYGEHKRALIYCDATLNHDTDYSSMWLLRAAILAALRDYSEAVQSLDMVDTADESLTTFTALYRGYFAGLMGDMKEANAMFNLAGKSLECDQFTRLLCRAEVNCQAGNSEASLLDAMHAADHINEGEERYMLMLEAYYKNDSPRDVAAVCRQILSVADEKPDDDIFMALGHALTALGDIAGAWDVGYSHMRKPWTQSSALSGAGRKLPSIPDSLNIRARLLDLILGIRPDPDTTGTVMPLFSIGHKTLTNLATGRRTGP